MKYYLDDEVYIDFVNSEMCVKGERIVYSGKEHYNWDECDIIETWYRVVTVDEHGHVYIYLKFNNKEWLKKVCAI